MKNNRSEKFCLDDVTERFLNNTKNTNNNNTTINNAINNNN